MRDVLDMFGDLPDYPGKTPPKNREGARSIQSIEDPFEGVKYKEFLIDDKPTRFYTVGSVAQVLNRGAGTVRRWERDGWIPSPSFRTKTPSGGLRNTKQKGYRLYSHQQVEILIRALKVSNLWGNRTPEWTNPKNWHTFISYVKEHWIR